MVKQWLELLQMAKRDFFYALLFWFVPDDYRNTTMGLCYYFKQNKQYQDYDCEVVDKLLLLMRQLVDEKSLKEYRPYWYDDNLTGIYQRYKLICKCIKIIKLENK